MKVIRKTILEKINEVIRDDKESIYRIELTPKEFEQFINCLRNDETNQSAAALFEHVRFSSNPENHDYSGSYIVYNGVCVQTHNTYKD